MGIPTLISTGTASNSAALAFTGIDNTYDEYMFVMTDINPATNDQYFTFNGSDDTSSWSYDITKTTTVFQAFHTEDDGTATLAYAATQDIAQGTGYQTLMSGIGGESDESGAAILHLFSPASTTDVTHFYCRTSHYSENDMISNVFQAGYFNTTAAITALNFNMTSGNFDGVIQLYGIA